MMHGGSAVPAIQASWQMLVHARKCLKSGSLFWDVQSEQTIPFYLSWGAQGSNSEVISASVHVRTSRCWWKCWLVSCLSNQQSCSLTGACFDKASCHFARLPSFTRSISGCQLWSGHIVMVDDTQAPGCFPGAARPCEAFHSSWILWIWASFELHPSIHITSYSTYVYEVFT